MNLSYLTYKTLLTKVGMIGDSSVYLVDMEVKI